MKRFCEEWIDDSPDEWKRIADGLIRHEGGYNPQRYAEYAEQECSWGMFQNNVCVHERLSYANAKYIYWVLVKPENYPKAEYDRLFPKYGHLLDPVHQTNDLIGRMKARSTTNQYMRLCHNSYTHRGYTVTAPQYCAIRHNNWNGGNAYVNKVLNKSISLYR